MKWIIGGLALVISTVLLNSHSGGLDANGGHFDRRTGKYHYHREPASSGGSISTPATPPSNSRSAVQAPAVRPSAPVFVESPLRPRTDTEKAASNDRILRWQEKQAAAGLPSFQYELGMRYLNGDGVTRDTNAAIDWLTKAAEQRNAQAKRQLLVLRPGILNPKSDGLVESEVEQLRKENDSLNAENQTLRNQLAEMMRQSLPASAANASAAGVRTVAPHNSSALSHWITTSSGKRHNSNCRYFKTSNGRPCAPTDGIACKICGG